MSVELTPSGTRGITMPGWMKTFAPILAPVFNMFLRSKGHRLIQLSTVGAKSGRERTVYLSHFPDPGHPSSYLVVASFGGSIKHPAWYVNMAKNPDQVWITLDGNRRKVRAESLSGQERDETFRRIAAEQPQYAGYEEKTDRVIPVVRLTPV